LAIVIAVVSLVTAAIVVHVGGTMDVRPHGEVAESFRVFLGRPSAAAILPVALLATVSLIVVLVVVVFVAVAIALLIIVAVMRVATLVVIVVVAPEQRTSVQQIGREAMKNLLLIVVGILAMLIVVLILVVVALVIVIISLAVVAVGIIVLAALRVA
jgi:hypothetical protein